MMHGTTMALAFLGTALAATPTFAAYNGFYFGLEGGYESNGSTADHLTIGQPPIGSATQERRGGTGLAYGLFLGYDFELSPRWFAGVEGSASMSNADIKFVDLDGAPAGAQGVKVVMKNSFALSAQLGYMVLDRLGLYARVGLPGARIKYKSLAPGSPAMGGDSSYFSTYQVGAGLQYAVGRHLFTRLEYTYSDLELGPAGALDGRHRVMLGIGLGY